MITQKTWRASSLKKRSPEGLGDQFSRRMYARAVVWSRSGGGVYIIRHKKGPPVDLDLGSI